MEDVMEIIAGLLRQTNDAEVLRYKILSILQECQKSLRGLCLQPALTRLADLKIYVDKVLQAGGRGTSMELKRLKHYYLQPGKPIYRNISPFSINSRDFYLVMLEINDIITSIIDELVLTASFISANIKIVNRTDHRLVNDEGYVLVNNGGLGSFYLYAYNISIISSKIDICITEVKRVCVDGQGSIKRIEEEFPIIADNTLFICNTEYPFPVSESVLPLFVSKLVNYFNTGNYDWVFV
ncbi:MAG: hypothetical protein NUV82_03070 [Candidatus Komeilibacteria bacterium]|nr:hypothetical protein [Candidatus Komeilibacteria bacterium]